MNCIQYNAPLIWSVNERSPLQKGQLRLRTYFAGINYAGLPMLMCHLQDILSCQGKYQEKAKLPFTPGLEVSGEVIECCGCNHVRVGDHVFCIFSGEGGYSEECVTEENRCFLVPEVFAC